MRRGLSLLLMVVLVLRGLASTAMAAGVLPPATAHAGLHSHAAASATALHANPAAHQQALGADPVVEGAHQQGHGGGGGATAGMSASGGSDAGCADAGHHATGCSACEICHSAMLDVPAVQVPKCQAPSGLRMPFASRFDSAPPARAIKPPIA